VTLAPGTEVPVGLVTDTVVTARAEETIKKRLNIAKATLVRFLTICPPHL